MNNLLSEIESEDLIIYTEQKYNRTSLVNCKKKFLDLYKKGIICNKFSENEWKVYSGVHYNYISFDINSEKYREHFGSKFCIDKSEMINMIKCFTIYCSGVYIYATIAHKKVDVICNFIQKYENVDYKVKLSDLSTIISFLKYINIPESKINIIVNSIRVKNNKGVSQRQLSPLINYFVIENEINDLYSKQLDDDTFKKWFPVYFWVNITFILPLRATEMLVTPLECITIDEGGTYLNIRRTLLKKKNRKVYYDIKKDYKIYKYKIPNTKTTDIINKYIQLTSYQKRPFIFEYCSAMVNKMVSLDSFNSLLNKFMDEYIIGNVKYDFIKYATGIKEFEYVTAGDSRPIAMANLCFQKVSKDICRQLADHVHINTSAGYYTNVSETIWNSSIMKYQKEIIKCNQRGYQNYKYLYHEALETGKPICTSPKRRINKKNIEDCEMQNQLEDCIGCKFYIPTKTELERYLQVQEKKSNESSRRMINCINNIGYAKNKELLLEDLFLEVQTEASQYRTGCEIKAKEKVREWQKLKNTRMIFY